MCGVVINGVAHGPRADHDLPAAHAVIRRRRRRSTSSRGAPSAFPVIKDLVVDRGAFDRIIQAGGYISAPTGTAPDAHAAPVPKRDADHAFDAATCIGCGACVAACPNGSAMLFTGGQDHPPRSAAAGPARAATRRVLGMVAQHDDEGFGGCTNIGECTAVCPKGIPLETISRLNRDLLGALLNPQT